MVNMLGELEKICDNLTAFWTSEADNFDSQGGKMATNQMAMIKSMKSVLAQKNVDFWMKAKEEMNHYAAMVKPETKMIYLPTHGLNLCIPSFIDLGDSALAT